jgi:N-acetylmuramoyl-L-alanine amidase
LRKSGLNEIRSPNCDARGGAPIDILLLHYTEMESAAAAIERLCDPVARVSSHYVIDEDGAVMRLVPEELRAWHAGLSSWGRSADINARSIGIEIQNKGHPAGLPPYPDAQIEAVIALGRDICARHSIPAARVLAHSDVAPARKIDPGEHFPWARLAEAGLGLWPGEQNAGEGAVLRPGDAGEAVIGLKRDLAAFGYGISSHSDYDEEARLVVAAFQRHFRPENVTGEADAETRARLKRLNRMAESAKTLI